MPRFLNSANFLFQIINMIGPLLFQFSKFWCSTVYSLPVISRTRTLIGWTDVLSLINTTGSILTVKTLPGIVICQTLPARFSFPRFCNWGAGEVHARWRVWERDYALTSCWGILKIWSPRLVLTLLGSTPSCLVLLGMRLERIIVSSLWQVVLVLNSTVM